MRNEKGAAFAKMLCLFRPNLKHTLQPVGMADESGCPEACTLRRKQDEAACGR